MKIKFGVFLVASVSLLILFIYASFWVVVVFPWLWWETVIGLFNIITITTWMIMIFICYYKSVLSDPGSVPKDWEPPYNPEILEKAYEARYDNFHSELPVQFCIKCTQYRPTRAHHCRYCNKCIFKMDHHCPWINNCVGHFNHKSFLLFLFYASFGLAHIYTLFFTRTFELVKQKEKLDQTDYPQVAILAILNFLISPVVLGIMYLFYLQVDIVKTNTTSVEQSKRKWQEFDAKRDKKPFVWMYDYGSMNNFKEVFGSSFIEWPFPSRPKSDGINWKEVSISNDGRGSVSIPISSSPTTATYRTRGNDISLPAVEV